MTKIIVGNKKIKSFKEFSRKCMFKEGATCYHENVVLQTVKKAGGTQKFDGLIGMTCQCKSCPRLKLPLRGEKQVAELIS